MPRTDLLWSFAALFLATTPAAAQSDPSATPFRDEPVALAQAAALERIEAAARALTVVQPSAEDEAEDEAEGPAADLALFRASLAAASPKLAKALAGEIEEMTEAGKNASRSAKEVVELSEKVPTALLTSKAVATPAFRAALMASLLLDEGGVAETYEEATGGDAMAYATGYFVLQRVRALWSELSARATPEQAGEVKQMLAMLDALFPSQTMPERLSPDPEEAEAPSHQLVSLLETITGAALYPGRDLAGAGALVHDLAQRGCTSLASEKERAVGAETLLIAAGYYGQTVKNTIAVMAPDAAEPIAEAFEALREGTPESRARACGPLLDALAKGQAALNP